MYRYFLSADFVCGSELINKNLKSFLLIFGVGRQICPLKVIGVEASLSSPGRLFQFLEFFVFCIPELTVMASMQNFAEYKASLTLEA